VSGEIVEGEESTLKNVVNSSFVDFERMIIRDVNHDNAVRSDINVVRTISVAVKIGLLLFAYST
jgi:hypothetical protein